MTFGSRLRNLLEERGLSQKQLAFELSIAPSTLGNYIQDTREPDFATLKQFAEYFQVSIDYLLSYQPKAVTTTEGETELLRIYRSLSGEQQQLYIEQGRVFIKLNAKKAATLSTSKSNKVV